MLPWCATQNNSLRAFTLITLGGILDGLGLPGAAPADVAGPADAAANRSSDGGGGGDGAGSPGAKDGGRGGSSGEAGGGGGGGGASAGRGGGFDGGGGDRRAGLWEGQLGAGGVQLLQQVRWGPALGPCVVVAFQPSMAAFPTFAGPPRRRGPLQCCCISEAACRLCLSWAGGWFTALTVHMTTNKSSISAFSAS
jgi:hypothetical protein